MAKKGCLWLGVKHWVFFWVLGFGCGGGAIPPPSPPPRSHVNPCPLPDEVRVTERACIRLSGTKWRISAQTPSGLKEFEVELMAGGRVRANDHPAASPGFDEWFLDQGELRIFLGNRFVEYRARVSNGTVLGGLASNVQGERWEFRARRLRVSRRCLGNEAQVGGSADEPICYSAAGSRWKVEYEGKTRTMILEASGRIWRDDQGDATKEDERWEQEGPRLRLFLEGGKKVFEAEIQPNALDRLVGRSEDGKVLVAQAIFTHPGRRY
ncbi:MAG: hypothetical protein NZM37_01015 [Sandaracinaceae bacterium]|nr:hypothetical protein [Sandaracinaceae bacterium]